MSKIQTCEKVDLTRAKKLFNLPREILVKHLSKNNPDREIIKLKNYLNIHIINDGKPMTHKYKYSDNLRTRGRLWSIGTSAQSIKRNIRCYLFSKNYHDFDMVGANQSLLYKYLVDNFPDESWIFLGTLLEDRENILKEINEDRDKAKEEINILLNSDNPSRPSHPFLIKLDKEFKKARELLFHGEHQNKEKWEAHKGALKVKNKKGTWIAWITQILEAELLEKCIKEVPPEYLSTLMFDGLFIDKKADSEILLSKFNQISESYGVTWKIKKQSTDLNYLDNLKVEEEDKILTYGQVKTEYEKRFFMIEDPVIFGCEYIYDGRPCYSLHNKADFKTLTAEYTYHKVVMVMGRQMVKPHNFFNTWIEDKTKRKYKRMDFYPTLQPNNLSSEFYNTFIGWDAEQFIFDEMIDEWKNGEIIETFKNHIYHLCGREEEATEYIINFIADIIQNPSTPSGIGILMKSPQGHGKDLTHDIISNIIGTQYYCRTEDIKDVLGNFNTAVRNKVVIVINELEGKDGWDFRDKLKGHITSSEININEKGVKHYKQRNCSRVWINSNRMNPIEVSQDDRRFVVLKSYYKKPSKEYFKKLIDIKDSEHALKVLYEYFKSFKITKDLRSDRPITKAYENMRNQNVNPIFRFLNEIFINNRFEDFFEKGEYLLHKKTGDIYIDPENFCQELEAYYYELGLPFVRSKKNISQVLSELEITKKSPRGKTGHYVFKKEEIKSKLSEIEFPEEESLEISEFE